jgi:hypothetical protein
LSKRDYIDKLKRIEDYEREQKLNDLIGKGNDGSKIRDIKNRIYSSRIYKINDIKNEQRNNICKIQKILRNGEGEDEENLDILMEEFPDNPKIALIVKKYQIKKNNIENDNKVRLRLYSSHNINLFTSGNNKPNGNNYISQSTDKRRIFIYANDKNGMNYNNKNKNELIKKEERRINNTNPNRNNTNEKDINFKEKYPDLEEDEIDDFDDNEEIEYEHEIAEKVRQFKAKIYKNFLKKLKIEKKNEFLRNKQLEIITDMTLKRNLEIQFSKERTLVDQRLKKESERLQKQAKEYESNLRNNYNLRQQRLKSHMVEDKNK